MNRSPPASALAAALELRLTGIEYAGRDTSLYRFSRPDGGTLPPAAAGSHITLTLPLPGPGPAQRQYSIIRPGAGLTEYVIAVKREPAGRGGSAYMHDVLRVGAVLQVEPPRNNFPLLETAPASIFIAGGIGVTPLIAMARRLVELDRPYTLHVALRGAEHAILSREIDPLPHVSRHFDDTAGFFFPMSATIAAAPRDAHLYCCGPAPMIESFLACAAADNRDDASVHVEYFAAPIAPAAPATEGSFIVELARSGRIFTVPAGTSILNVLREAGVATLSNCEQGVCGACEVKVLEGIPDHRDAVLSPAERRQGKSMMICCSGALTDRLVLDL
jgi:ferredoxin-NADP reductase